MADEMETKQAADVEMKDAAEEEAPKENGDGKAEDAKEVKDEEEEEEEKEPEKPAEKEEDAAADSRPKVAAGDVKLNPADCTMNSMQTANGKVLMTLTEGGMQYLLASSRATTGIKAGRYAFEVKILETLNPSEGSAPGDGQRPIPRNLVRVGLSLSKSSIFLADTPDSICFDSEGYFLHGRKRARISGKFIRGQAVTLVVNMMEGSPNANTVSLFRNGTRLSQPQKIPEALVGKTLYPTVTYRNVTVQVNLGPVLSTPLPFTCRMVGDAAAADVEVVQVPKASQNEVLFPVGMPDQGYFDWVDDFVSKNPTYSEISDRKIAEWAAKSGMWRAKNQQGSSSDKPESRYGIPFMDDGSVRKVLESVAPTLNRSFIIPELKANLVAEERKKLLEQYAILGYKPKATVIMGEPPAEYKAKVQELIFNDKKLKAEAVKKRKAQEDERKRLLEERRKKAEEAKKAKLAASAKKAGKTVEEDPEEKEEDAEEKAEEKEEDSAPVELTDEEKALWYRKKGTPDLDAKTLSKFYASFSLPTTEEGFAAVDFAWQPKAACEKTLREWVLAQKMTQKVQDLAPGEWFKTEYAKWQKQVAEWRKRQSEWKDPKKRKEYMAKKAEEAKKKKAEAAKEAGEEPEEAAEEEAKEINAEDIDVYEVEDVCDLGNGEPLFAHFVYEDWVILGLHFELHMLLHGFKKDLNDPDRPSFPEEHLGYYYQKYVKKAFKLENFNLKTMQDFLEIVKESVVLPEGSKFLKPMLDEDTSFIKFMQIAEDHRRDRQRRLDAGDETAKLKFNRPTPPPKAGAPAGGNAGSRYGSSSGPQSRSGGYQSRSAPTSYSSGGSRGGSSYSGGGGGGGSSQPWKRGPPPAPAHPPSKYQRTSSYGAAPRGGSGGYYRR